MVLKKEKLRIISLLLLMVLVTTLALYLVNRKEPKKNWVPVRHHYSNSASNQLDIPIDEVKVDHTFYRSVDLLNSVKGRLRLVAKTEVDKSTLWVRMKNYVLEPEEKAVLKDKDGVYYECHCVDLIDSYRIGELIR